MPKIVKDPRIIASIPIRHPKASSRDLDVPWWNSRAVRYLNRCLPANARVFEWGSGGSTVWLTHKGAKVIAIESDVEWQQYVHDRSPEADVRFIPGTDSGTLRSEVELRDRGEHFFDDYVAAIDDFADDSFNLIVIDGLSRCHCAVHATKKVRADGLVLLDDTHYQFFAPAFRLFHGWKTTRIRGFKRPFPSGIHETTFFRRPR